MVLVPTVCANCRRCALAEASALANTDGTCRDCGGVTRVVPGPRYDEGDADLFDSLFAALRDAQLLPSAFQELRQRLEEPLSAKSTDLQRLNRLVAVLPTLALVDAMVDEDRPALRKAESMLTLMLDALSQEEPPS